MERVLVAVDEDAIRERVIDAAGRLASDLGASVTVCHVMTGEEYEELKGRMAFTDAEGRAKAVAEEAAHGLKAFDVHYESVGAVGRPVQEILQLAEERSADLIMMGIAGLHGLSRLRALGSVSRAVVEQSDRPILIVPNLPAFKK